MNKKKIALLGCGNIANFHIPALVEAGFEIVGVSGRKNSKTVEVFANKYGIDKYYNDPIDLIKSDRWDCLVIATPVGTVFDYIVKASKYSNFKPILCEKPVENEYDKFINVDLYKNVRVAYNRRFYNTVQYAKNFIDTHPQAVIRVSVPESSSLSDSKTFPGRLPYYVYENSSHIFDAIKYMLCGLNWTSVVNNEDGSQYLSTIALGVGGAGNKVVLDMIYDAPQNFSIDIIDKEDRVEMRPIEILRHYKGMKVVEPSKEFPIRQYKPNLYKEIISSSNENSNLKPGFLEQSKDFMSFCTSGVSDGATLKDAKSTIGLIDELLN
jgi:hypothetical protein